MSFVGPATRVRAVQGVLSLVASMGVGSGPSPRDGVHTTASCSMTVSLTARSDSA
jgi:hypothetical protein